jgi:hypothetical protein
MYVRYPTSHLLPSFHLKKMTLPPTRSHDVMHSVSLFLVFYLYFPTFSNHFHFLPPPPFSHFSLNIISPILQGPSVHPLQYTTDLCETIKIIQNYLNDSIIVHSMTYMSFWINKGNPNFVV